MSHCLELFDGPSLHLGKLRCAFESFDADKDGMVSSQECRSVLDMYLMLVSAMSYAKDEASSASVRHAHCAHAALAQDSEALATSKEVNCAKDAPPLPVVVARAVPVPPSPETPVIAARAIPIPAEPQQTVNKKVESEDDDDSALGQGVLAAAASLLLLLCL